MSGFNSLVFGRSGSRKWTQTSYAPYGSYANI
jgi:hypothetical protein